MLEDGMWNLPSFAPSLHFMCSISILKYERRVIENQ